MIPEARGPKARPLNFEVIMTFSEREKGEVKCPKC